MLQALWDTSFQDLSITIMSDVPAEEIEILEDPEEIHKIYKQSFIDEQVIRSIFH